MSGTAASGEIDHVAFGALRLDSARQAFEQLGFALTERGRCTWSIAGEKFEAASACVMFERCYVDVIENADPRWRAHLAGSPLYARGVAPSGIVLRAASLDALMQRLDRGQIGHFAPYDIERRLDGSPNRRLRYRLLPLDRRAAGGLPLAFVYDATPRAMRTPRWLAHPNGAVGIARISLHVPDATAATRAYDAIAGAAAGRGGRAGPTLHIVHQPSDDYLRAAAARLRVADRAALLALTFRSDLDATAAALRQGGVNWTQLAPGRIAIDLEHGFGCGILFEARSP